MLAWDDRSVDTAIDPLHVALLRDRNAVEQRSRDQHEDFCMLDVHKEIVLRQL